MFLGSTTWITTTTTWITTTTKPLTTTTTTTIFLGCDSIEINLVLYKVEQSPSSVSVSLVSSQSLPEVVFNQPMPDFYPCLRLLKFIENQKKWLNKIQICAPKAFFSIFFFSHFLSSTYVVSPRPTCRNSLYFSFFLSFCIRFSWHPIG